MKIVRFYNSNRSNDKLHIETEGCIVNIQVNLTDDKGNPVTAISILPDSIMGDMWYIDGFIGAQSFRVVKKGE